MNPLSLRCSIDDAVFTFLDVETTGLSPRTSRVCEVALVGFQRGCRVSHFSSLVNPGLPIPPETTKIHGITDAMVAGSPAFPELAPRIIALLEGSVIVAHNAEFDLSFIEMEFSRAGLNLPQLPVIDTLHIARHLGGFSNNRLGTIAKELDISAENWHRALSDVEITRKIFEHFMVILKKDGASTVADVVNKIPKFRYQKQ
jgi:DNA polymerase-3 subunit alpha (Gram-positive type)